MAAEADAIATKTFLAEACSRSLLAADQAAELSREALTRGLVVSQLAVEKGVMDPLDVDMVQTLLRREEALPGYEILDVLGRGGMGVVYRCRQTNLDRVVAIKTVLVNHSTPAGAVGRFEQEARTVAKLRHPNIVTAYDFGRHEGRLYFVMELLEGQDLEKLITRQGRLDEASAWGLTRQAAAGLAHASQLGVVHRDIKPANLFLVNPPDGFALPLGLPMVKITDFGLVLQTGPLPQGNRLTQAGTTLGTPLYMAPEQYQSADVDSRADIYGLGATVYHMLLGEPPFAGKSFMQIVKAKASAEPPLLPPPVSSESSDLVALMMAPEPNQRIANYVDLLDRIDNLPAVRAGDSPARIDLSSPGTIAQCHSTPTPDQALVKTAMMPGKPVGRLRQTVRLAALPVLAAIILLAWLWFPSGPEASIPAGPALVPSGRGEALFDGTTLTGWIVDEGGWTPEADAEGAKVLAGKGIIRRHLPPYVNFRITLEADMLRAAAIEVQFGISQDPGSKDERYVLRISPEGILLGNRPTNHGPVQHLSPALAFRPSTDADNGPSYREIRVERQGAVWLAVYDGQSVGHVPVLDNAPLAELRLATEGGPAHFGTLEIVELMASPP